MKARLLRWFFLGTLALFLAAPLVIVAGVSVNEKQPLEFPPQGFSLAWSVTYGAFFLASLSIIGMPPLGGFLSKWNLVVGAIDGGQLLLVAVVLVSSLLNASYFFPIVYRGFFAAPADGTAPEAVREAPILCLIPLSITALFCLALFLWPTVLLQLIQMVVSS